MIKTIADSPVLASAIILVCALFTYGGAVNMGWSGFTMAIPFMALWFFVARQSKKPVMIISAILFIVIVGFYGLKKTDNPIFYPANDTTIILAKDTCFNVYADFVLTADFKNSEDCLNTNKSIPDVRKSKIMSAGTPFTITRTEISHADMGEHIILYADDSDGELYIENTTRFNQADGAALTEANLRQPYFYYPSILMLWPAFPVLIFTAFSHGE